MKTQITITTQVSFLADINERNQQDLERAISHLERNVSPGASGFELALASYIGRVQLQRHETEVYLQIACRACGCTEDNCEQCIEAQGEPCHWVEADLCSRCAGTLTSPSDGAQNQ